MDARHRIGGSDFVWDVDTAEANRRKHGIAFEHAATVLNNTLKKRLAKDRPVTSITLRIPVDVVDSLKAIAPRKGLSGYQTLLKAYISEGLRRDEATFIPDAVARLASALKKRGVSQKILDAVMRDLAV